MNESREELKSCPLCGSEKIKNVRYIWCMSCNARWNDRSPPPEAAVLRNLLWEACVQLAALFPNPDNPLLQNVVGIETNEADAEAIYRAFIAVKQAHDIFTAPPVPREEPREYVRVPREVVEWIVNDGDGREVFPEDLSGDPCPVFKTLQQSLLAAAPQEGWSLSADKVNDLQTESINALIKRCKQAHFVNVRVFYRINGQWEEYEADWIKHMKEVK